MRVLTLNVHNPHPDAVEGIADFLDESGAELIALTECGARAAENLGHVLDCQGLAHAPAPYWGNALLARTMQLSGCGAVLLPESALGEARSAAVAGISLAVGSTRFIATHLAVESEEDRLLQAQHLVRLSDIDLTESLLLGDLNALTRSDYDTAHWREIEEQRARAGLGPPRADLTGWLQGGLGLEDAHHARPVGAPLAPTCRYGTRVDYVLIGPRCALRPVAGSYRVLAAMQQGLTDHDAVVVDLEPRWGTDRVV